MEKINVLYQTQADNGFFYTSAQMNVDDGHIKNIVSISDEDAEEMNCIFKTNILFDYDGLNFEYDIDPVSNKVLDYKNTLFYKMLMVSRAKKELDSFLPMKKNQYSVEDKKI